MTDHLQLMRDELVAKRDAWARAIEAIDIVIAMTLGPSTVPAPSNGHATRAEKRGRTDGRSKARASATRSLPDGAHAQAIVAALTKHGPTSPGDLARALKWDMSVLRYRMKPLLQSKTVLATGATINRVLSLPGRRAKEAP